MITTVATLPRARWQSVSPGGVELIRGVAGNNPHTLVADAGTCSWTVEIRDPLGLGIAVFTNTAPAYLIHPSTAAVVSRLARGWCGVSRSSVCCVRGWSLTEVAMG